MEPELIAELEVAIVQAREAGDFCWQAKLLIWIQLAATTRLLRIKRSEPITAAGPITQRRCDKGKQKHNRWGFAWV